MSFCSAKDFLQMLNRDLIVQRDEDGEVCLLERDGHPRQGTLPLIETEQLTWAVEVDQVLEGECSDEFSLRHPRERSEFPLGKCGSKEKGYKSWLHTSLQFPDLADAKHIVVYADCCGSYQATHQQLIREQFPRITWHFPPMRDLYRNGNRLVIAKCLLEANLLKVVPK